MSKFLKPSTQLDQRIYLPSDEDFTKIEDLLSSTHWRADEVEVVEDVGHWRSRLNDDERLLVTNILTEFLTFDILIMANLSHGGFAEEILNKQLSVIYAVVAQFESLHSVTYSKLAIALIGTKRLEELLNPLTASEYLNEKTKWYSDNSKPQGDYEQGSPGHIKDHARRVVVGCATEGLFFNAKFCSVYWFKRNGRMPGLVYSNELISRDEAIHCRIAAIYYKKLGSPLRDEEVVEIVTEACELECNGIDKTHPTTLVGLSVDSLKEYVRHNCNFILSLLLNKPVRHYDVDCPFKWMDSITVEGMTNFFEKRVSEYRVETIQSKTLEFLDDF